MDLLTLPTRKRQRSQESDYDQSLPISKRINQLHIRPSFDGLEPSGSNEQWPNNCAPLWANVPTGEMLPVPNHLQAFSATSVSPDLQLSYAQGAPSFANHCYPNHPETMGHLPPAGYACSEQLDEDDPQTMRYEPELTADENPFYYSMNEQLFLLHVARLRRQKSV